MAGQRIKNTSCSVVGDDSMDTVVGTVDDDGWSRMLVAVCDERREWCSENHGNTD